MPESTTPTPAAQSSHAFRAVVNGVSLLLLVALAIQTGAVAIEASASGRAPQPDRATIRTIAEEIVRRVERVARRQGDLPAPARLGPIDPRPMFAAAPPAFAATSAGGVHVPVLSPLVTDLPPPALPLC